MGKKFKLTETITGWVVFAAALITYLLTLEPTASLWDCGEYIASAFKLEVQMQRLCNIVPFLDHYPSCQKNTGRQKG